MPHAEPPQLGFVVIERVRHCEPPTHDCEHAPQNDHGDITQSVSGAPHGWLSLLAPHGVPAPHELVVIERVRDCVDGEQPPEHAPQADHGVCTQFVSQHCGLQPSFSDSGGQAAPPHIWVSVIGRVREREPPLQGAEQAPHGFHGPTSQLVAAEPQPCDSLSGPHGAPPPHSGVCVERVRVCVPEQADEHEPHADHGVCTQLVGQQPLLHPALSLSVGQPEPPHAAFCVTGRVRV